MADARQTDDTKQDALVGQLFEGRFKILSVIGEGGMGKVYKAHHVHMDKIVAIKTLVGSTTTDEKAFLRFQQESRAASSLAHPNIINIFDFGASTTGIAYLVMEYLEGKTLEEVIILQESMSLARFQRIFNQVCSGMQHAHKKGLIHRDLKPSNLMIFDTEEEKDVVKILDFGLAKASAIDESKPALTRTGMVMGSPPFMSPEQCRGDELDYRCDIYSLGCVMYAALTGEVPLIGSNTMATLYKHISDKPNTLAETAPHLRIPVRLDQIIMQTLEKSPDARPQSMNELNAVITASITNFDQLNAHRSAHLAESEMSTAPLPQAALQGQQNDLTRPLRSTGTLRDALVKSPAVQNAQTLSAKTETKAAAEGRTASVAAKDAASAEGDKDTLRKLRAEAASAPTPAPSPPAPAGINAGLILLVLLLLVGIGIASLQHKLPSTSNTPSKQVRAVTTANNSSSPSSTGGPAGAQTGTTSRNSAPGDNGNTVTSAATTLQTHTTVAPSASDPKSKTSLPSAEPIANRSTLASQNPSTPERPSTRTAPAAVSDNRATSTQSHSSVIPKISAPAQAAAAALELQTRALSAYTAGQFEAAFVLLQDSLGKEKIAYGNRSPKLLPTIAAMAKCCRGDFSKMDADIYLATTIYRQNPLAAQSAMRTTNNPYIHWHALAQACHGLANSDKSGSASQVYMQWSGTFFNLTIETWGNKRRDREYLQIIRQYSTVATALGNDELALSLMEKLQPPNPPFFNRPGRPPLNADTQPAEPSQLDDGRPARFRRRRWPDLQ